MEQTTLAYALMHEMSKFSDQAVALTDEFDQPLAPFLSENRDDERPAVIVAGTLDSEEDPEKPAVPCDRVFLVAVDGSISASPFCIVVASDDYEKLGRDKLTSPLHPD